MKAHVGIPTSPFRTDALKGKVAFITGGATGICYGIAVQLGKHGAHVGITGRRQAKLDEAVAKFTSMGIKAMGHSSDVRDPASVAKALDATVSHFGHVDIVVNGAAGNFLCSAEDLSPNGFRTVMAIDTMGTFNVCHAALPVLEANGGGVIVNISATLHYGQTAYQAHASAAKAAVDSLTRSLAAEWGPKGIRVVGIAPGPITGTEGMRRLSGGQFDTSASSVGKARLDFVPSGRLGTVEDIGLAAVYLVSGGATYVTGDTLVVDGANWLYRAGFITPEIYEKFIRKAKL